MWDAFAGILQGKLEKCEFCVFNRKVAVFCDPGAGLSVSRLVAGLHMAYRRSVKLAHSPTKSKTLSCDYTLIRGHNVHISHVPL